MASQPMDESEEIMKTLIAIPCMDTVPTDFFTSFTDMEKDGAKYIICKNTLIYDARNRLAAHAIENEFDAVLWLDSDMTVPNDVLRRFKAHLEQGKDYISGICFSRRMPPNPVIYSNLQWEQKDGKILSKAKPYLDYPKDQTFEIAASGFGCVMTSVKLLKEIWQKFGAPFLPLLGLGEDMAFCLRCINIGAKMYCDSTIKCGHVGYKEFTEEDYLR